MHHKWFLSLFCNKIIKRFRLSENQPKGENVAYLKPGVDSLFLSYNPYLWDLVKGCPIDFLNFDKIEWSKVSLLSSRVKDKKLHYPGPPGLFLREEL